MTSRMIVVMAWCFILRPSMATSQEHTDIPSDLQLAWTKFADSRSDFYTTVKQTTHVDGSKVKSRKPESTLIKLGWNGAYGICEIFNKRQDIPSDIYITSKSYTAWIASKDNSDKPAWLITRLSMSQTHI